MSAPARQRTRSTSTRTAASSSSSSRASTKKDRVRSSGGATSKRGTAGQRAYAKRAHRARTMREPGGHARSRLGLQHWPRSRATFVVILMGLMLCGVAASLWLSTQAIADSYRLERLREQNAQLAEHAEQLRREVGQLQSPSSLAERAKSLGMVPGGNPARLVVGEDGSITVVGEPVKATAPAPPPEKTEDDGDRGDGSAEEEADESADGNDGETDGDDR
nr:cell division protein ZapB [Saccharomonospora viridis]